MATYWIFERYYGELQPVRKQTASSPRKALQKLLDQQTQPYEILSPSNLKLEEADFLVINEKNISAYNASMGGV